MDFHLIFIAQESPLPTVSGSPACRRQEASLQFEEDAREYEILRPYPHNPSLGGSEWRQLRDEEFLIIRATTTNTDSNFNNYPTLNRMRKCAGPASLIAIGS